MPPGSARRCGSARRGVVVVRGCEQLGAGVKREAKERRAEVPQNPQRLHNAVQGLCTAGLARVEVS